MPHHHIVQNGENLSTIAAQYGTTRTALEECNPELAKRRPKNWVNSGDKVRICKGKSTDRQPAIVGAVCARCPQCVFTSAEIRCSNKQRTFVVTYPILPSKPLMLLQVIASSTIKEKLYVTYHGECGHKKQRGCPNVEVDGGDSLVTGGSVLEADILIPGQSLFDFDSYEYFWKHILSPNQNPARVYTVRGTTCIGSVYLAIVQAFPKVEWRGELSVGFKYGSHKDSNFNQNQGWKMLNVNGEWTIDGSISVTCDERKWELGFPKAEGSTGHNKKHAVSRVLFKGMQSFIDKLSPILGGLSSDYGKLEIMWPLLKLGGGVINEESKDRYSVDVVGEVKLSLDPLIGVKGSTDILNLLILICTGGFGAYLVKIKKKIAEGYDSKYLSANAVLEVILSASACIKGSLEWRIARGEKWSPKEGEVAMEIAFSIEGKAEANIRVFVFKAGAGVSVGAKTAIGAKLKGERSDAGPGLRGKLYFTGLKVYYSYYYEVGGSTMKKGTKKSGQLKDSYEHEEEVFPPVEWPQDGQKIQLASGVL